LFIWQLRQKQIQNFTGVHACGFEFYIFKSKFMLVIRFSRVGRRNHAQYRIVVQEKSKAPTGKHVAIVGSYDPHSKQTVLKEDEIKNFIANGAQPSDSVYNLLVRNDVIKGKKRVVKLPEKKTEEAEQEPVEGKSEDKESDKKAKLEEKKDKEEAEVEEDVKNDNEKEEEVKEIEQKNEVKEEK